MITLLVGCGRTFGQSAHMEWSQSSQEAWKIGFQQLYTHYVHTIYTIYFVLRTSTTSLRSISFPFSFALSYCLSLSPPHQSSQCSQTIYGDGQIVLGVSYVLQHCYNGIFFSLSPAFFEQKMCSLVTSPSSVSDPRYKRKSKYGYSCVHEHSIYVYRTLA